MKEYCYLFAILTFIFTLCKDYFPLTAAVILILIAFLRTESWKSIILIPIFLIIMIPRFSLNMPEMNSGKAVIVKENYSILEKGNERIIVYPEEPLIFDAEYEIKETLKKTETSPSFFGFDSHTWTNQVRACWYCNQVTLIRENNTFRSWVQKKILSFDNETVRTLLNMILLNIQNSTVIDSSLFSYAGMILFTDLLLKYLIEKKKRKIMITGFVLFLTYIYRFPFLLVQMSIFRLLRFTNMTKRQQTGIGYLFIMIIFPAHIRSISFLLPAIYRMAEEKQDNQRLKRYFNSLLIQSYLMNEVNPFRNLLYPYLVLWYGFGWWCGLLTVISGIPFIRIMSVQQILESIITRFTFGGNIAGFGLIFFVMFLMIFRNHKYHIQIYIVLFFLFQCFGLFHPFAEVTFINVGQGDSILINAPLHSNTILIDTGKPSKWNVLDTYLSAKGIHTIDTLIITHSDDDHAGNTDAIIAKYHVKQLITAHTSEICSAFVKLYDLNEIENEDTNQSSLVIAFEMNGLKYLFMGDADEVCEEKIVRNYPHLDCDILKLSHHGSKTGTSKKLIETVRPELSIISAGNYELYHHPSEETIQRLLQFHIPYFNTNEEGDISIICFPFMNLFVTSTFKIFLLWP